MPFCSSSILPALYLVSCSLYSSFLNTFLASSWLCQFHEMAVFCLSISSSEASLGGAHYCPWMAQVGELLVHGLGAVVGGGGYLLSFSVPPCPSWWSGSSTRKGKGRKDGIKGRKMLRQQNSFPAVSQLCPQLTKVAWGLDRLRVET